jgi:hypothetical protein
LPLEDQEKTVKKVRSRKKRSDSGEIDSAAKTDSKAKESDEKPTRKKVRRVASKKSSVSDGETTSSKAGKKEKLSTKKVKKEQPETGEPK